MSPANLPMIANTLCGVVAVYACLAANVATLRLVDQVNRHSSPDEQVSALFWYPGKWGRLVRRYRDLYPNGRLHRLALAHVILMFAAGIGLVALGS